MHRRKRDAFEGCSKVALQHRVRKVSMKHYSVIQESRLLSEGNVALKSTSEQQER
jgi:hypothetical protein